MIEQVAQLGAQLLLQTALEAEVTEFLGRERYARAAGCDDAREGSRNGYSKTTIKTTTGPVTLRPPKLRNTTQAFASRLLGAGVTKTHALESLVIAGFVRGLSPRDVEAALGEALGEQAAVSRSTESRICAQISEEMTAWQRRRLDELELDYLFLDASFFRYHVGAAAEPVLAAWGITTAGKPVFVGLDTATGESTDAWLTFLTDLGAPGLRCPLLVVSDGAPGLISAVEQTMPAALRQKCLVHRSRNVLSKIPKNAQDEVKADYWALFDLPAELVPGLAALAAVQKNIDGFASRWRDAYPAAVRCLLADRESLTHYLRTPAGALDPGPAFQLHRAHLRRDPPPGEGHRPATRRDQLPRPGLGRARPLLARRPRVHHDPRQAAAAPRPAAQPARNHPPHCDTPTRPRPSNPTLSGTSPRPTPAR